MYVRTYVHTWCALRQLYAHAHKAVPHDGSALNKLKMLVYVDIVYSEWPSINSPPGLLVQQLFAWLAMADGPNDRPPNEPQSLEDLKREITCSMCHRHYERAKLLPCNHYYCQRCIECLAKDSLFRSVDCPKCRKTTNLPHNSAEGLDDTLVRFVDRKVQVYDKMAAARGEKEPKCGQCDEGGRATAFCRDASCADFICVNCEKLHKSLKVFYGHKVVSLAELAEGGVKAVPIKETPLPKCPDHDGKEMELYCRHCDRLICAFCVTYEHHTHKDKTGFLSKCAAATRETLRQSLKPLQSLHAQISTAETALSAEEAKVHAQKEELLKSVRESFQKIEDDLKQRKGELITKIGELSDTKEAALGEQKEGIQTAMKEIESLLKLVKQNAESAENQDLMRIHTQLEVRGQGSGVCIIISGTSLNRTPLGQNIVLNSEVSYKI